MTKLNEKTTTPSTDSTSHEIKKHNIEGHLEQLVGKATGNQSKATQGAEKIQNSLAASKGEGQAVAASDSAIRPQR